MNPEVIKNRIAEVVNHQIVDRINENALAVKKEIIDIDYLTIRKALYPSGYFIEVELWDIYNLTVEFEKFLIDIYDYEKFEEYANMIYDVKVIESEEEKATVLTFTTNINKIFVELKISNNEDHAKIAIVYDDSENRITLDTSRIDRKTALNSLKILAKTAVNAKLRKKSKAN